MNILTLMREYATESRIPFSQVGVYRYDEKDPLFDVNNWNYLITQPSFREVTAFIPSLGGQYRVGLYDISKVSLT